MVRMTFLSIYFDVDRALKGSFHEQMTIKKFTKFYSPIVIVLVMILKYNIEAYDNTGKRNVLAEKLSDISSKV